MAARSRKKRQSKAHREFVSEVEETLDAMRAGLADLMDQRSRLAVVDVQEHKTTLTLETHIQVVGQDDRPAVVYELMMVFM